MIVFELDHLGGPQLIKNVPIDPGEIKLLGSGASSDIQLPGQQLAEVELVLHNKGNSLEMRRIRSINNLVMFGGQQAPQTILLRHGDVVTITGTKLLIQARLIALQVSAQTQHQQLRECDGVNGSRCATSATQSFPMWPYYEEIGFLCNNCADAVRDPQMRSARRGSFEILRKLKSQGGLGVVFEARQLGTNIHAIVKELRPFNTYGTAWRETVERFVRREQRVYQAIRHPNIVRHLESSSDPLTSLHTALEFIKGPDLFDQAYKTHILRIEHIAAIARDIYDALACIHHYGIVHRDISPFNVMLHKDLAFLSHDEAPHAKLIDFGLAISVNDFARSNVTSIGRFLGNPPFASPEQLRDAHNVGPEADIYSAAVTIYWILKRSTPQGWRYKDQLPTQADYDEISKVITRHDYIPVRDILPNIEQYAKWQHFDKFCDLLDLEAKPDVKQRSGRTALQLADILAGYLC